MTRWLDDFAHAVRSPTVGRRTEAATDEWLRYLREQEDWFILFIEFWSHAVREPALRDRFAVEYSRLPKAIAAAIASSAAELDVELPLEADELGLVVNALGNGLLLDKLLEPEAVPDELYRRFLDLLFSRLARGG